MVRLDVVCLPATGVPVAVRPLPLAPVFPYGVVPPLGSRPPTPVPPVRAVIRGVDGLGAPVAEVRRVVLVALGPAKGADVPNVAPLPFPLLAAVIPAPSIVPGQVGAVVGREGGLRLGAHGALLAVTRAHAKAVGDSRAGTMGLARPEVAAPRGRTTPAAPETVGRDAVVGVLVAGLGVGVRLLLVAVGAAERPQADLLVLAVALGEDARETALDTLDAARAALVERPATDGGADGPATVATDGLASRPRRPARLVRADPCVARPVPPPGPGTRGLSPPTVVPPRLLVDVPAREDTRPWGAMAVTGANTGVVPTVAATATAVLATPKGHDTVGAARRPRRVAPATLRPVAPEVLAAGTPAIAVPVGGTGPIAAVLPATGGARPDPTGQADARAGALAVPVGPTGGRAPTGVAVDEVHAVQDAAGVVLVP